MKKLNKLLSLFMAVLIGAVVPMLGINACAQAAQVQTSSVCDHKAVSNPKTQQKSCSFASKFKKKLSDLSLNFIKTTFDLFSIPYFILVNNVTLGGKLTFLRKILTFPALGSGAAMFLTLVCSGAKFS